jgi:hypothetical protein
MGRQDERGGSELLGTTDCISAAAQFIARQRGGVGRILTLHYRLVDGRCAGCTTASKQWPCLPASVAIQLLDRDRARARNR